MYCAKTQDSSMHIPMQPHVALSNLGSHPFSYMHEATMSLRYTPLYAVNDTSTITVLFPQMSSTM